MLLRRLPWPLGKRVTTQATRRRKQAFLPYAFFLLKNPPPAAPSWNLIPSKWAACASGLGPVAAVTEMTASNTCALQLPLPLRQPLPRPPPASSTFTGMPGPLVKFDPKLYLESLPSALAPVFLHFPKLLSALLAPPVYPTPMHGLCTC